MAAYRRVRDMHVCVAVGLVGAGGQPTTGFMTTHAVTCRLTASSPGSVPAPTLDSSMGTFAFFNQQTAEALCFPAVCKSVRLLSVR